MQPLPEKQKSHEIFRFTASTVDIPTRWNPRATDSQRTPGDSLNFRKLRFYVISWRYIVGFELQVSAPFVRFCNDLHPLHVLKPCKIRAETVHLLSDK